MKFVDKVIINIKAGHGGTGAVSFRREKFAPKGGPDGGNGGDGGSIIFIADKKLQTLMDLHLKNSFKAKNGLAGSKKNQYGANGEDLIIKVPCGTMLFKDTNTPFADLTTDGDSFIAAKGGKGGKGNKNFATPKNRTPRYAQPGLAGVETTITLELRLIAEIGLIGLPNAGKSTLLKKLTSANPKIASYPFTTLYPNLGVLKQVDREIILADIPGIIEGASKGHGLGHDFLRHIDRTKFLLHLIDISSNEPKNALQSYQTINKELSEYHPDLKRKKQIVILSKIDTISDKDLKKMLAIFLKNKLDPIPISAHTGLGIKKLINTILKKLYDLNK